MKYNCRQSAIELTVGERCSNPWVLSKHVASAVLRWPPKWDKRLSWRGIINWCDAAEAVNKQCISAVIDIIQLQLSSTTCTAAASWQTTLFAVDERGCLMIMTLTPQVEVKVTFTHFLTVNDVSRVVTIADRERGENFLPGNDPVDS